MQKFFTTLIIALVLASTFAQAKQLNAIDPSQLEETIIKRFLDFANSSSGYIHEMISEYKKSHTNPLNPNGGIETPVRREHLHVFTNMREDIDKKFCNKDNICVVQSTKQQLLISIPVSIHEDQGISRVENLNFTMKGGFKTTCKDTYCEDSSIFYLPEDVELTPRMHHH